MGAPVSARESARRANLAHSGALRSLDDLTEMGVVYRIETRGQHLYTINGDNELVRAAIEPLFAFERARVADVFDWVEETLDAFLSQNSVQTAVIFGSAARGEDRPGSDFDLLVVTGSQQDVESVHQNLADASLELFRRFGLSLSPVVVAMEPFVQQYREGDSFARTVLREGRQVAGVKLETLLEMHTAKKRRA